MDITKISRFFSAPSSLGERKAPEQGQASDGSVGRRSNSEAVTFSSSFGSSGTEGAEQKAKVAALKRQVQSGEYRQPDGETLAKAFIRDVFA